jgi:hypothetical protein
MAIPHGIRYPVFCAFVSVLLDFHLDVLDLHPVILLVFAIITLGTYITAIKPIFTDHGAVQPSTLTFFHWNSKA